MIIIGHEWEHIYDNKLHQLGHVWPVIVSMLASDFCGGVQHALLR